MTRPVDKTEKQTKSKRGGRRPGSGRKPGSPNKTTANVKEALETAFQGVGGIKKLQAWGKKNPTEFFKLWAKLLPASIHLGGADGSNLFSDEQILRMAEFIAAKRGKG